MMMKHTKIMILNKAVYHKYRNRDGFVRCCICGQFLAIGRQVVSKVYGGRNMRHNNLIHLSCADELNII